MKTVERVYAVPIFGDHIEEILYDATTAERTEAVLSVFAKMVIAFTKGGRYSDLVIEIRNPDKPETDVVIRSLHDSLDRLVDSVNGTIPVDFHFGK